MQYNDIVIGKFGSPRVYELVLNTIFARRGKWELWSALSSFLLGLNYFQCRFWRILTSIKVAWLGNTIFG